jgi:DNA-binding MarR family transcriptional regulator
VRPVTSRAPAPVGEVVDAELVEAFLSASRALVAVAARSLASGGADITLPQYRALVLLASRGALRVSDLAELLAVNGSTATRLCDRLQVRGLVARDRSVDDRRSVNVSLTASGAELVHHVTVARRRDIGLVLAAMPVDSRQAILGSLRAFASAAGEVPEQSWSLGWGE